MEHTKIRVLYKIKVYLIIITIYLLNVQLVILIIVKLVYHLRYVNNVMMDINGLMINANNVL